MSQLTITDRAYQNSNLFSSHYLDERIRHRPEWDCDSEAEEAMSELQSLYQLEGDLVEGYKEDALIDNWIDEVLDILGYGTQVETTLPEGHGYVDILLFENEEKRRDAALVNIDTDDTTDLFNQGIGIVEAKQWDADFNVRFSEQRPYRDASHQVKHYLENVGDIEWGILTNGRKWRLYGTKDYETKTYYEVDLPELLSQGDLEQFKYFYLFFRPEALRGASGSTFLEKVWSESETASQQLGEDLQDNVFTALRVLGHGFIESNNLDIDPDDTDGLNELKEQSLVLLYRLMFVLYAESRNLIHPEGQDAIKEYENNFSLDQLRLEIHDTIGEVDQGFENEYSEHSTTMWRRLEDLFRLIDKGEESLGIPPYNGGLFDRENHTFLAENSVSNRHLAEVIYRLSTTENSEGRYVLADYADLDTRHLGSVYEGLLEHQFRIAPEDYAAVEEDGGQVWKPATEVTVADAVETVPEDSLYVVNDEGERKATGAYYTPDYVVTHIVEETVDPLVNEVREDLIEQGFEPGTQEYLGPFLRHVTDLKILDPAMGSGHFLTRATGYLTEQVMNEVREIETEMGVAFDEQHIRREIAKECIYGVDLNGMAVELAKLSMWLDTLAADRPLAFLDHHLKTGNSLIGSDVTEVLSNGSPNNDDGQITLTQAWAIVRQKTLEHVMERMQELLEIDNETLEDVKSMEEIYDQIRDDPLYQRLFKLTNVHTAERFDLDVPQDAYEQMAAAIDDDDKWSEIQEKDWFKSAQALNSDTDFFHWELEYPEVFFDEEGEKRDNAGFDAVIGNPPYSPIQRLPKQFTGYFKSVYDTAIGNYDLYVLFIEKGVDLLNNEGKFGYIIPNKVFQVDYGEALRNKLATNKQISGIADFGSNQVFAGAATTYTTLLFLEGQEQEEAFPHWKLEDDSDPGTIRELEDSDEWDKNTFENESLSGESWNFHRREIQTIINKAESKAQPLEEIAAAIGRGTSSGDDSVFELQKEDQHNSITVCTSDAKSETFNIETEVLRKPIHSTDFGKYTFTDPEDKCLIWPYDSDYNLIPEDEFSTNYPQAWSYLEENRDLLEDRADYSHWYDYSAPRNLSIHDEAELLIPLLADSPSFSKYPEPQSDYILMASGGFAISLVEDTDYSELYVLSLINSNLLFMCLQSISNVFRGGYITCTKQYFQQLPIREIQFNTPEAERKSLLENAISAYESALETGDTSEVLSLVEQHINENSTDVIHDLLAYFAQEITDLNSQYQNCNLSLLDHLGSYSDGQTLSEVGLSQPPAGSSDSILTDTAEDREKLKVGTVEVVRESPTSIEIQLTARYKPEDEEEGDYETDQWGYTETDLKPALQITDLSETEADLIEEFVPVAISEAGGFANFRETATKTNSLVDRLRKLTLPEISDIESGLDSYLQVKDHADELEQKIDRTNDLINEIVYELYKLTDEEIEIVEETVKQKE